MKGTSENDPVLICTGQGHPTRQPETFHGELSSCSAEYRDESDPPEEDGTDPSFEARLR